MTETVPPLLAGATLGETDWQARVTYYLDSEFVKRFLWLGQEPNYTAALHFVPIGISLTLFLASTRWRWFYLLSALLNVLQIFGTLSRAGTLLALTMAALVLAQRTLSLTQRMTIALSLAGVTAAMFDEMNYIFTRLETVQSSISGDGASGRFALWEYATILVSQAPLSGVGPGGFRAAIGNAAHNTFAEAIVELGLIGGITYALFLIFPILHAYRMSRCSRDKLIAMSYWFYLAMGLTISFYQFFIICFMAFLCIASPLLMDESGQNPQTAEA